MERKGSTRLRRVFPALVVACMVVLGFGVNAAAAAPTLPQRLTDQLANCKDMRAVAQTSGERTWADRCSALAQRAIDAWYAANPQPSSSPSVSPSGSPSASPSLSPSASPSLSPSASPSSSPSASPSPSPSPSPTNPPPPTGITNCLAQLDVCGYPTAENTGVQEGIALTTSSGDLYLGTAGMVLQNRQHTGCIYVTASNVTIRNVRLFMADRCFYGLSTYDVPSGGITTVENTEVMCNYAHGSALAGPGFRVSRAYLSGCENGFEINGNSQISDSWIAGSEVGNSNAHGDDIQSQGGNNVVIRHNTFAGLNPITASIITNPTQNSHWLVELNFMRAGAYTLYCPEDPAQGDFVVRNNRFYPYKSLAGVKLYEAGDRNAPAYGQTDACAGDSRITWTGNYDEYLRVVPAGGLN